MGSIISLREYAGSRRRGPLRLLVLLYRRFAGLAHELAKFGVVGLSAAAVDIGGSNLLFALGLGPLTSKTLSMFVATSAAYVGSRYWTFRHRAGAAPVREYFLFWVMNGIGLLLQLLCIGFTVYTLGLESALAFNISGNVIGLILATAFRFWAYKKWVFLPPDEPPVDPHTGLPEPPQEATRPAEETRPYPEAR